MPPSTINTLHAHEAEYRSRYTVKCKKVKSEKQESKKQKAKSKRAHPTSTTIMNPLSSRPRKTSNHAHVQRSRARQTDLFSRSPSPSPSPSSSSSSSSSCYLHASSLRLLHPLLIFLRLLVVSFAVLFPVSDRLAGALKLLFQGLDTSAMLGVAWE